MRDGKFGELTHVATVQRWECDSNDHLNVQFFHQRFREAGCLFRQRHEIDGPSLIDVHTRFHRELRVDDQAHVFSLPVCDANGESMILHHLVVEDEGICCTCLDRLPQFPSNLEISRLSEFDYALPRGLSGKLSKPVSDTGDLLNAGSFEVSCIMQVQQSDFDHEGSWQSEKLVSSFSNGGQTAWGLIGATAPWLRRKGLGRVVLEMRFSRFSNPKPGTMLRQVTDCLAIGEKTYRFRHRIEDAITGGIIASGEVLSILLDLKTRKSVVLPEELRVKFGIAANTAPNG